MYYKVTVGLVSRFSPRERARQCLVYSVLYLLRMENLVKILNKTVLYCIALYRIVL